jgi:hypothetical protein
MKKRRKPKPVLSAYSIGCQYPLLPFPKRRMDCGCPPPSGPDLNGFALLAADTVEPAAAAQAPNPSSGYFKVKNEQA